MGSNHGSFRSVLISMFTGLLLIGAVAQADKALLRKQDGYGADLRLFRSAIDTKGHFTVDGSEVLPHHALSLSLTLDFGFNGWIAPELKTNMAYKRTTTNVYLYSVLIANWGVKDMFVFGAGIPIALPSGYVFDGRDNRNDPTKSAWSTSGKIGDISFHTKLRWIRADRHPIGLATIFQYNLPTGDAEYLMGSPRGGVFRAKLIVDMESRNRRYRGAINLGAHLPLGALKTENNFASNQFALDNTTGRILFKNGPKANFGIGNSFSLWQGVMDFVLEVYGNQLISQLGRMEYLSVEANAGVKMYIEESSYLLAGYAHGLPLSGKRSDNPGYGHQAMEHRVFLGFAYEPSIGDKDRDGIKDDIDQCPLDPEDYDEFLDSDGCPEPDNDMDGLLDPDDACPLIPEDADGVEDEDGCPERNERDRDGDGILDEKDKCPDNPEDHDDFEDKDGCPDVDNDKDGILDIHDECPNDPEDIDGFEDKNGCPDPDNDRDRILDVDDKCPDNPEVYNGKEDTDGCPDQGDVILQGDSIRILKKVYFEYDSANIKKVSYDILNAVAETIKNNPQIELVEIGGHADQNGSDTYNLKLTKDRAASVKRYLLSKGVKEKSVISQGYGEYCPVEEGSTEAINEKNRRVEFKVLVSAGMPTGARRGCELSEKNGINPPPITMGQDGPVAGPTPTDAEK
ncbi:MAG: OmpA family protein [Deltaproteobacteria bacterium]|nr:OmpA family protein [Deltaproteobacteria bacterium]